MPGSTFVLPPGTASEFLEKGESQGLCPQRLSRLQSHLPYTLSPSHGHILSFFLAFLPRRVFFWAISYPRVASIGFLAAVCTLRQCWLSSLLERPIIYSVPCHVRCSSCCPLIPDPTARHLTCLPELGPILFQSYPSPPRLLRTGVCESTITGH